MLKQSVGYPLLCAQIRIWGTALPEVQQRELLQSCGNINSWYAVFVGHCLEMKRGSANIWKKCFCYRIGGAGKTIVARNVINF